MARPREFDERDVLDAASGVFWEKGFEGTSTRALVSQTGLSQPSLYNAFGDKRSLFLRAFEHYLNKTLRERIERLESTASPVIAISAFFGEVIELSVADPLQRGCLLVNSALEGSSDDTEFRSPVARGFDDTKAFFHRCLVAALATGAIPPRLSADDAAAHLLALLLGLRVLARVDRDRAVLTATVAPTLALLGLPPLAEAAAFVLRPRP